VCGEVVEPTRIDSGCVICNPVKWQAALKPEVPVSTGPADRADGVGCLQHGIVGCQRCIKLEFRHRTEIDPGWEQDPDTGSWQMGEPARDDRLTLLVLAVSFLLVVGVCFAVVYHYWPR
jgi:hypothetical protein